MELKACQSCGGNTYEIIRDPYVFKGQNYGKRYPIEVSTQPHGYKFRCECGMQTCWWHYKQEAIDQWNTRTPSPSAQKVIDAAIVYRNADRAKRDELLEAEYALYGALTEHQEEGK